MDEKPKTKYVIMEKTLAEIQDFVETHSQSYNEKIYEREIEHEDMTEEQRLINEAHRWETSIGSAPKFSKDNIYDVAQELAYKEILGGTREGLKQKIKDTIMDSKITASVVIKEDHSHAYVDIEYGDLEEGVEYVRDEEKMLEELKKVRREVYNWQRQDHKQEYVTINKVEVNIYTYSFNDMEKEVGKIVDKFMRKGLTYCIKQDKIIVPEEYIAKGQAGIKEWRDLKASKNNNNNMEKRMLRGMIRDKKASSLSQMQRLLWHFPKGQRDDGSYDYNTPFLYIYGSGNRAMSKKLVTQIIGKKADAELLNMTEEEIDKEFKKYWKEVLQRAIKQIDNVGTYDKK